ncbi:MAG: hypothetical protein ACRD68_05090 [Pyrinomonadaceae bacterium]
MEGLLGGTMKYLLALSFLVFPPTATAQKSMSEYTSAQRAALQSFIAKNPAYRFIPEAWFEEETLKAARSEWGFGKNFKPYYQTGDFNRDGIRDFAVILLTGKNVNDPDRRMHVVVFNGAKGGKYRVARIQHEEFSTAVFISTNRNKLYVGVMETDSAGCFVPDGRGYKVIPCGN